MTNKTYFLHLRLHLTYIGYQATEITEVSHDSAQINCVCGVAQNIRVMKIAKIVRYSLKKG